MDGAVVLAWLDEEAVALGLLAPPGVTRPAGDDPDQTAEEALGPVGPRLVLDVPATVHRVDRERVGLRRHEPLDLDAGEVDRFLRQRPRSRAGGPGVSTRDIGFRSLRTRAFVVRGTPPGPRRASSVNAVRPPPRASSEVRGRFASISCLATCTATGAWAAMRAASRSVAASRSAAGTTSETKPHAAARSASIGRPVRIICLALAGPDDRREPGGHAPAGHRRDPDLGRRELHVVRGEPQIAGQGKLEPAAVGDAVERGDRRLAKRLEPLHDPVTRARPGSPHVERCEAGPGHDVGAGREGLRARAL